MQAGKLRHRVTVEQASTVANAFGEPAETWAPFATVWASREDLSGREQFLAQQWRADVTTRFVVRYVAGLTPAMRINDGGTLYNINSIADADGRARTLTILATRVF